MGESEAKIVVAIKKPKKVAPWAVELSSGKKIIVPFPWPHPLADCRGCALYGWVCDWEMEYPCEGCRDVCPKRESASDCEECDSEQRDECITYRPCCWECGHLLEYLECARDDEFVKGEFGASWEEFIEAIKMLVEPSNR
jgi:hypothetical protein